MEMETTPTTAEAETTNDDVSMTVPGTSVEARTDAVEDEDKAARQDDNDSLLDVLKSSRPLRACPYLGTVNRHVLDFDFEKLCSVSLSQQRPYGCLVCGKYFQGRSRNTHAMTHALEAQHYIFINLLNTRIYCLPDNYEVLDKSLDDIKYHLNPTYEDDQIAELSVVPRYGKALDGTDFIPGCVGLNNLKQTDFFNVVIQLLCNVIPLRNSLLKLDLSKVQAPDRVLKSLGELIRKIFNPCNFKGIVSPHEFLQAVAIASNKEFRIGHRRDPLALFSWLVKWVHRKTRNKKTDRSIVHDCFQGQILVSSSTITPSGESSPPVEQLTPALCLTLNIPAAPIFKNSLDRNVIPHLPIFESLQRYDGVTPFEVTPGQLRRYSIWKLPPYLVVHINRFSKNNFFVEKNPTIVTFPVKNLDLADYVHPNAMDLNPMTRYNLVANIFHTGRALEGSFRCHVLYAPTNEWYEIEDLQVTPTLPQMVALSESYVQLYQRQDVLPTGEIKQQSTTTCANPIRDTAHVL